MKPLASPTTRIVLLALFLACWACGPKGRPPNIVLILADDLGYECLGSYGGVSYQTPQLDRLAASGIRFQNCQAQPLCTPSRVKLLTGRYNFRNYTAFGALDPGEITLAHLLQQAGYATCLSGKWQLAEGPEGTGTPPENAGFDEHRIWVTGNPRYANPIVEGTDSPQQQVDGSYGPNLFCDYLIDFMERHKDQPFLALYSMVLPHAPFERPPGSSAEGGQEVFADMVAHMDTLVGRVVDAVDRLGLRRDTLVIFTSDNGNENGLTSRLGPVVVRGAKGETLDAATHVPLIARWPGKAPPDTVREELIDFSDFLPTLIAAGRAELPSDREIDGVSFLPQLRGEQGTPRSSAFCFYEPRHYGIHTAVRYARTADCKLYDDGRFFDTKLDPMEKTPLNLKAERPELATLKAQLQEVLDSYPRKGRPPPSTEPGQEN